MSFIISNPFPYLESLPYTLLSKKNYFEIFESFGENGQKNRKEILYKIKRIFEKNDSKQDEKTISKNYIPMYKSLGIIDDDLNLTKPLGINITKKNNLQRKQFEFLYELFHRKWFIFTFYNFYRCYYKELTSTKSELLDYLVKALADDGFYVKRKSGKKYNPNQKRIDGVWNILYFTGIINRNSDINEKKLIQFESYIKNRIKEEDQDRSLEDFIKNVSKIISKTTNENEIELIDESEEEIENFLDQLISNYKKLNERYVFIDDLENQFIEEVPNFFDKLWLLQEEGKALLVPGRFMKNHKTYRKYGRRYSKIMIYEGVI